MVLASLILMTSGCSDEASSGDIDRSTPEAVVASFCEATNNQDVNLFRSTLDLDDSGSEVFLKGFEGELAAGVTVEMSNVEVYTVEETESQVQIKCVYDQTAYLNGKVLYSGPSGDNFTLVLKEDGWYIAPSYSIRRG
jgi:hypothetical protein